jgi:hypothetical protein
MPRHQPLAFLVFGALSLAGLIACKPKPPATSSNIVRQIDHILIASSDPNALFTLLTDTLQLPVAWPMTDYGAFASGGVAMGNANLEIIKETELTAGNLKSRWTGFALEPEPLRKSIAEMDARGIRHGTPSPFRSNLFKTRWTTVGLPDLSEGGSQVFLCEYTEDASTRRKLLLEQLQERDGGPLKVIAIKEMVLGARDVKRMEGHWRKLLDQGNASSRSAWALAAGPAILLTQADKDGIIGLVVHVESLQEARRYLKEHDLLGAEQPAAIKIAGSQLKDLNITLIEQPSGGLHGGEQDL